MQLPLETREALTVQRSQSELWLSLAMIAKLSLTAIAARVCPEGRCRNRGGGRNRAGALSSSLPSNMGFVPACRSGNHWGRETAAPGVLQPELRVCVCVCGSALEGAPWRCRNANRKVRSEARSETSLKCGRRCEGSRAGLARAWPHRPETPWRPLQGRCQGILAESSLPETVRACSEHPIENSSQTSFRTFAELS